VINKIVKQMQTPALILPHDYQARCAAAIDNTLVIGHESGRVTFPELEGEDREE
jgi:hypothetical protein